MGTEFIQGPDCYFVASAKQKLKVHIKRKHNEKVESNPYEWKKCADNYGKPWVK